jgi:hypothetical protein
MVRLTALVVAAALPACIWDPVDGAIVPSRIEPVLIQGYASGPAARIQLRGWNRERGAWEPLREVVASTVNSGKANALYHWSVPHNLVGRAFWGSPEQQSGFARFQVAEIIGPNANILRTFDQATRQCTLDRIGDGEDYAMAGNACSDSDDITIQATARPVTPFTVDPTPPRVYGRITDDRGVWTVSSELAGEVRSPIDHEGPIRFRIDAYDDGVPRRLGARAEVTVSCRSGGLIPIAKTVSREIDVRWDPALPQRTLSASLDLERAELEGQCSSPGRYLGVSGAYLYAWATGVSETAWTKHMRLERVPPEGGIFGLAAPAATR